MRHVYGGRLGAAFPLGRPRDLVAAKRPIIDRTAVDPDRFTNADDQLDSLSAPAPPTKEREPS